MLTTMSVLSACASAAPPPQSFENHWLVGRWDGTITEYPGAALRTFLVTDVRADGSARAFWSGPGGATLRFAEARATGSEVKLITVEKSVVQLTKEGDRSLVGTFALSNGRSFAVAMAWAPESTQWVSRGAELDPRLKPLVGLWEGREQSYGGYKYDMLFVRDFGGRLQAYFGRPGGCLALVTLTIETGGSSLRVSFTGRAGNTANLLLVEEGWLSGTMFISGTREGSGSEIRHRPMNLRRRN